MSAAVQAGRTCPRRTRRCPGTAAASLLSWSCLSLLPQLVDLSLGERFDVIDHVGLNSRAGNVGVGDVGQILPSDLDLEGSALPAAGGIDIADVRGLAAAPARQAGGQPGQQQAAECQDEMTLPNWRVFIRIAACSFT